METNYDIHIQTTSTFISHTEKEMKQMFEKFLNEYKHPITKTGFESTEIKVKKLK